MRAMWKGAVSFGLVNVPVKMYTATESHDLSFHQVHRTDGGRIRYKRVCDVCGEQVPYDDIAKGYESEDGQLVILTDEDLAELPVASSREIAVEKFVPTEQIDPMWMEKSYYLEPEKNGAKPYALLREALREADRMALVTISIRQRSTMAVLRVRDDVIVLQTLLWPDEIRKPDFGSLDGDETARPQELAMAASLVESLSGDYDPDEFDDEYRIEMERLVDSKLSGGQTAPAPEPREETGGGEVVDLLSALQRSVERAREARGDEPAAAGGSTAATKKAAKKAPAKKAGVTTTATKSTAKKATAKTAAKKATAKKAPPPRPPPRKPPASPPTPPDKAGSGGDGEDHVQGARAVDAFDAVELDVAGGARPADEGQRPARIEPGEGFGHAGDDLLGVDDADVQVGHQADGPAAAERGAVQHDGAGLGDRDGAAGDHRVDVVELHRGQVRPVDDLAVVVDPGRQPSGDHDRVDVAGEQGRSHCRTDRGVVVGAAGHAGLVVLDSFGEPVQQGCAAGRVLGPGPVSPGSGRCRLGSIAGRIAGRVAGQGFANSSEYVVTRRHRPAHHSRKVWSGGVGRSREAVQPARVAGSLIRGRPRRRNHRLILAVRPARANRLGRRMT